MSARHYLREGILLRLPRWVLLAEAFLLGCLGVGAFFYRSHFPNAIAAMAMLMLSASMLIKVAASTPKSACQPARTEKGAA